MVAQVIILIFFNSICQTVSYLIYTSYNFEVIFYLFINFQITLIYFIRLFNHFCYILLSKNNILSTKKIIKVKKKSSDRDLIYQDLTVGTLLIYVSRNKFK